MFLNALVHAFYISGIVIGHQKYIKHE